MLARKSLLHFGNTIVGALLGLAALKLIALYLGDTIYGEVAYAMGLVGLLNALLKLGFPQAHVKRYSEGRAQADRLATYIAIRIALTLVMLVAVLGFIYVRVALLGKGFASTTLATLVLMAVYQSFKNVEDVGFTTFAALRETARGQLSEFVNNVVRTLSAIGLTLVYAATVNHTGPLVDVLGPRYAWIEPWGSELLAGTYLLGAALASLVALWYVVRTNEVGEVDLTIVRDYWEFARPIFLSRLVTQISSYIDRISLGYFWTASQAGIYFGVQRLTLVVQGLGTAVGRLLFPEISALIAEGDEDEVLDLTYRAQRLLGMVVVPITAFNVLFASEIINILLSGRFIEGALTLQLLAGYVAVSVLTRPWSSLIQGIDRPDLTARISASQGGLNIVLNLVLVPADIKSLGIELLGLKAAGAALATLASGVLAFLLYRRACSREAGADPPWTPLVRQAVAAGLMGAALVGLHTGPLPLARWYHLLAYPWIGLAVYLLALSAAGGFTRDDLLFFLETVSPREMVDYVREELLGR